MLNFDTALEMLNKYGYTSISVHPFVYQSGDTLGVCYTYTDEDYGVLERVKICETLAELEDFLKKYQWFQQNGKAYHVRMILDNYETINPKVIFLRNEKIMVEGEMFDVDNYDIRESQRANLDDVSKVIYEAGDLLLVYDEIKSRQLQYLKNLIGLKNTLRQKYYELQLEVDKYNKVKVDRNLSLLPEVTDLGINDVMEVAAKDKYNTYISERPTYEDAVTFLKEVWELNLTLELNMKYYEAQKEETDIRNEMKVVEQKTALMKSLNDDIKPLFGIDLVGRFKKINRKCKSESNSMSRDFIQEELDAVNRKYSMFDQIDLLYTSDYLREAIQNTNYKDLAFKYSKGKLVDTEIYKRKPLNDVASSLTVQYKERLSVTEQAILVLYNNRKYRAMFDCILNINNFENMTAKQIVKKLNGISGFSKIKSECYDSVKKRIDNPINATIKNSLFANYDFTSFETFVMSLVRDLSKLKDINNKMVLNGDINMYLMMHNEKDVSKKKFVMVTNDLNSLYIKAKETNSMIGLALLKEKTPVLYSPYYFDLGDIYSKDASPQMTINEMVNFELLVETSDIIINVDPNKNTVARYYSEPIVNDNLSVVDDIKMASKTTFCKFAFNSNVVSEVVAVHQDIAVDPSAVGANLQSGSDNTMHVSGGDADVAAVATEVVSNVDVNETSNVVDEANASIVLPEVNTEAGVNVESEHSVVSEEPVAQENEAVPVVEVVNNSEVVNNVEIADAKSDNNVDATVVASDEKIVNEVPQEEQVVIQPVENTGDEVAPVIEEQSVPSEEIKNEESIENAKDVADAPEKEEQVAPEEKKEEVQPVIEEVQDNVITVGTTEEKVAEASPNEVDSTLTKVDNTSVDKKNENVSSESVKE